ncbi:lipid storage droplets surface-binding protein 1 isoform X2 [Contarinia nasturtii]|uniref:lipid storage droplets surface-binding protein 1 isoform X2 n=1 Tax=Contarinia nasturtii TaxID=265458 RepID=UPI0012D3B376|nr:lipid storage droplets surface-binding protein 1 isoform X2 [Contarinia nasturtii]
MAELQVQGAEIQDAEIQGAEIQGASEKEEEINENQNEIDQIGNMVHANDHFAGLPRMEALVRIANIPLVETGVKTAGKVYYNLKQRNGLLTWSFNTAEGVIFAAVETVRPAVKIIEGPLHRIDQILCNSLDIVEQRVPSIYLPPQMMFNNTKEYMTDHLVQPVLKGGSMKHLGTAVLDSPLSAYAADRIDGAINVADKYVEKYLPSEDQIDSAISEDDNESKPIHTFHKSQRFSRKLKRRLTQRTILEARALKKQSKEAIHILIYAAELIATDPKLALEKARELWGYLSKDEPENQARPQTIEELLVLITRESARRMVHLINYTGNTATKLPKTAHLEKAKSTAVNEAYGIIAKVSVLYTFLQTYSSSALERLAYILAGRMKKSNGTPTYVNSVKPNKSKQNTRHVGNNSSRTPSTVAGAAVAANNNPSSTVINPNGLSTY